MIALAREGDITGTKLVDSASPVAAGKPFIQLVWGVDAFAEVVEADDYYRDHAVGFVLKDARKEV